MWVAHPNRARVAPCYRIAPREITLVYVMRMPDFGDDLQFVDLEVNSKRGENCGTSPNGRIARIFDRRDVAPNRVAGSGE